jgi:hypothetical protein
VKRVLLIGIDPRMIDLSRFPEINADQIRAAGMESDRKLRDVGYSVENCLIDLGLTAEDVLRKTLSANIFDCIMLGAGLRVLPEHTELFEKAINLIHVMAPRSKICFNTHPANSHEAVQRVMS